jgi:hypothetical protein
MEQTAFPSLLLEYFCLQATKAFSKHRNHEGEQEIEETWPVN